VSRVDDNTIMNSTDTSRFTAAKNATIWDPRADLDDDVHVAITAGCTQVSGRARRAACARRRAAGAFPAASAQKNRNTALLNEAPAARQPIV
jgi:hypothetical protein